MKNATTSIPDGAPDALAAPTPKSQRILSLEPLGQRLMAVTEGSELHSLSGPLQILIYPGQADSRLPFHLQAGQGWRSTGTGWVSVHNPQAASCRCLWRMAAENEPHQPTPATATRPQKSRPGLTTWGRLMEAWLTAIRPGRRAT